MTKDEIKQVQNEYEQTEMADLSSGHLQSERHKLYHKWFTKMLDHIQGRNQPVWMAGVREDDTAMRKIIEQD